MDKQIHFPALVITDNSIDKLNYRYLVGDKRYVSKGFRDVLFVDSKGNCFDVERVTQVGGFSLYYSIKLVGYMVRIGPILKQPVYDIDLQGLKEMLTEIIKKHPKRFAAMYDGTSLTRKVNQAETIPELIDMFY